MRHIIDLNDTPNLNDLVGKPFAEDGYGPDNYSCYGLAVEIFRRYGIDIPKTNIAVCACKAATEAEIEKHVGMYWQSIEPSANGTLVAPCICLIKAYPGYAQHVGVYIGNGNMIHVSLSKNTCIEKLRDWKHKINGYYIFKV